LRPATMMVVGLAFILACAPFALMAQEAQVGSFFTDSNVILSVTDVRKSVAFYETVLEFKLEHYVIGSAKEVTTLSSSDPEPYAADLLAGVQRISLEKSVDPPKPGAARYVFHVKDAAAYYDRIVKRGVSVQLIAQDAVGRPFWFSIVDPDGHWFMFMGPVGRR